MIVDVVIEDERWAAADLVDISTVACEAVHQHLNLTLQLEVVVLGCNDARIAELNETFRNKARATNVLSWPTVDLRQDDPGFPPHPPAEPEIGDIALAYDICELEASDRNLSLGAHATHLIVHGVLHLLGYDHETELDRQLMEQTEIQVLETLAISNPYVASV